MRRILIATAMAMGLIALWAAILPLTAQPAPAAPASPAFSKALFLCRGSHGIDKTCAAELARALVLESSDTSAMPAHERICHPDPKLFASVERRE